MHDSDDLRPHVLDGRFDFTWVENLPEPPLGSIRCDCAPARSATSFIRAPKTPLMQTSILSPGSIKLTTTVSIPGQPVPEIASVSGFLFENVTQKGLRLIHDRHEVRIKVPE